MVNSYFGQFLFQQEKLLQYKKQQQLHKYKQRITLPSQYLVQYLAQYPLMQAQLTSQQYEQVLKYMQATSEQNFQSASLVLKQHNFNLNSAINARFSAHDQTTSPRARHQRPHLQQQQQENEEQIIRKYIEFVKRENQSGGIISNTYNFVKNFTVGLVKLISEIVLPETLLRKLLRSKFYVLYRDEVAIRVEDDKLVRMLLNTKEITHKACFVVISPDSKEDSIVEMLNKNDLVKKIQQSYFFAGFVGGDSQLQPILDQRPPQVVICRYNIYKQLVIIKRYIGPQAIRQLTPQQLNRTLEESRNMCKRDKNVLVKYRNFIRRQYYGHMYVEEEEEEEVNFVSREEDTHHIRQQNQEYERMQEEERRREQEQREQEQRRRREMEMVEEKEEERKVRKMSIPDQPVAGDIVRFSFRCPDGSNISRSFLADEKVELLYHWVETNDQIELQDNKKRQFEILYSYPPTPLTQMKDKLLKEVFESDQEKLLIREL